MLVTVTQFRDVAKSPNGVPLPIGHSPSGYEQRTTNGAFAAIAAGTTMVRIATDTTVQIDASEQGVSNELLPGGTVEWFEVVPGQVLTLTAVV